MKMTAAFPSKYLKCTDLQGRAVGVVIDKVRMEDVGDGESKPVLTFQGRSKGVVLNKTNASVISSVYGDDSEDWCGKPLELYPDKVSFQGRIVDAIRVRIPAPAGLPEDDIAF
jgi:hypothetical protein